jgi:hypothetical protein
MLLPFLFLAFGLLFCYTNGMMTLPLIVVFVVCIAILIFVVCLAIFAWSDHKLIQNRLYVDDLRPCPKGWCLARNFHEAIFLLEQCEWDEVSLDHDIASFYGNKEMTGRDILNWLIARKLDGLYTPKIVKVHSANVVGCATMEADIQKYFSGE